jgi:site-specific DNA-methyltransferase (adenine-specific)
MEKKHLIVIGDPRHMADVPDESVQLVVTSPPFFEMVEAEEESIVSIEDFGEYLQEMQLVFNECYRTLEKGRYICVNVCDVISHANKYPIPAHYVLLLQRAGFEYREDIIWRKPRGTGKAVDGAEKRFGVLVQHPYPMYYFPNNVLGHILVLRKGKFDYKKVSSEEKRQATIDIAEARRRWNSDIWDMRYDVKSQPDLSQPILFPDEIPEALIRLYTYEGETVLDPFLGSGTSAKVAASLARRAIGYELNRSCLPLFMQKSNIAPNDLEIREAI